MGCHFLLQGIFPTQGSNPGLLHCRQMLYHLSHQGSQMKVKVSQCRLFTTPWTSSPGQNTGVGSFFPSPADLPNSGIEPGSPALQVDSSPTELTGEPYRVIGKLLNIDCKVAQSCDPMDCSPSGSSVHGIFQARILEWVAISLFRGSS